MKLEDLRKNYNFRNPIIQTNYTSDPAPMVYNDRVYLYTGHDEDRATWFTMNEWRCYSSADMVNWTDHGSPSVTPTLWAGRCLGWAMWKETVNFTSMSPLIRRVLVWQLVLQCLIAQQVPLKIPLAAPWWKQVQGY